MPDKRSRVKSAEIAGFSVADEECVATIFSDGHVMLTTFNLSVYDESGNRVGQICAPTGIDIPLKDLAWAIKPEQSNVSPVKRPIRPKLPKSAKSAKEDVCHPGEWIFSGWNFRFSQSRRKAPTDMSGARPVCIGGEWFWQQERTNDR